MICKSLAGLAAAAALLVPMNASAQLNSAHYLVMQCNNAAMGIASTEAAICINYLLGVVSGANMDRDMFCPDPRMTMGQVAAQVAQYVKARPELAAQNRITAAYAALTATMPCGSGGNPAIPPRRPSDPVDPRDTAYDLMVRCDSINRNPVVCMNYLIGIVDGANIDREMFCPRAKNSASQMPWIYQKYAQAHPELMSKHRVGVVRMALEEAFPCKQ